MHAITFPLTGLHCHGSAFFDYLRLRKRHFVDALGWDIPHDEAVEMDQYDNPLAHYAVVLREGVVVGGARTMPTTAAWGPHSYMLRDAAAGLLPDIPPRVMPRVIVSPEVWECTRLVVSDDLVTQADRSKALSLIVEGLAAVVRARGGRRLMSLSPLSLTRALRQLGWQAERIGEPYRNDGDGRQYAVLTMAAQRHAALGATA